MRVGLLVLRSGRTGKALDSLPLPDWWTRPSDRTPTRFPNSKPPCPSVTRLPLLRLGPPSLAAPAPTPLGLGEWTGGEIFPPPPAMAAPHDEAAAWAEEAARRVWAGAVPLQVHLHDADVTALPPPPPFLVCVVA